jgi:hypothetical protein
MSALLIFTLTISIILWGLSRTTEKILDIRHKQREDGKKPIVYL